MTILGLFPSSYDRIMSLTIIYDAILIFLYSLIFSISCYKLVFLIMNSSFNEIIRFTTQKYAIIFIAMESFGFKTKVDLEHCA